MPKFLTVSTEEKFDGQKNTSQYLLFTELLTLVVSLKISFIYSRKKKPRFKLRVPLVLNGILSSCANESGKNYVARLCPT